MAYSIFVEVEENDNAEYMPLMVYEAHADPVPVERVRVEDLRSVEERETDG